MGEATNYGKNKKQTRVTNLAETGGGPPNEMELITTPTTGNKRQATIFDWSSPGYKLGNESNTRLQYYTNNISDRNSGQAEIRGNNRQQLMENIIKTRQRRVQAANAGSSPSSTPSKNTANKQTKL